LVLDLIAKSVNVNKPKVREKAARRKPTIGNGRSFSETVKSATGIVAREPVVGEPARE
jgi:hypothetical protein